MDVKKFQKNVEDFDCDRCHFFVRGNGYTNHCPECLWSKHVDVNPGDREELCGGIMKPIAIFGSPPNTILHHCEQCSFERRNKIALNDSFGAILAVTKDQGQH